MDNVKVLFRSRAGGVEFRKLYDGKMSVDGEKTSVTYEECDENGLTVTEVKIIKNELVTVERKGLFSNYLEFHVNYAYSGEYLTPYGKVPVEVFTRKMGIEYNGKYPTVSVEYKSALAGDETESSFYLTVKENKENEEE